MGTRFATVIGVAAAGGILRTKFMPVALLVAAVAAFGLASTASAGGTPTTVNIRSSGESRTFHGKVKSQRATCFKERKVAIYKQKGPMQVPSEDNKVAQDTSDNDGEWDTGNTAFNHGKYYARVRATANCGADNSPTLRI